MRKLRRLCMLLVSFCIVWGSAALLEHGGDVATAGTTASVPLTELYQVVPDEPKAERGATVLPQSICSGGNIWHPLPSVPLVQINAGCIGTPLRQLAGTRRCGHIELKTGLRSKGYFGRFRKHQLYWFHAKENLCWDGRAISDFYEREWTSDRYCAFARCVYERDKGHYGRFLHWNGRARGSHWTHHWARLEGCIIKYGCIVDYTPWIEITVRANGTYTGVLYKG